MSVAVAPLVERSELLRLARAALEAHHAWLVGGTVRDLLMGRPVEDLDLVVAQDAERAARELARGTDAHVFPLSERFGAWRVLARDRRWQADVTPLRDGGIEGDLALRDFTINAMAIPLVAGGVLLDPHGGRADLEASLLRVVSTRSYRDDPLRTLRLARLACELELSVDPETKRLAAASAPTISSVAPERIFYELRRLVISNHPLRGLALADEIGQIAILLPELDALKGLEQNPYHHLDAWGHTLAVLESVTLLERDPEPVLGEIADIVLAALEEPLADELTRFQALRLGALFHDIGKPPTRRVTEDGRILFWGHDEVGSELTRDVCRRLRTSSELAEFLAAIARHHLKLGFLVHERPLSRRQIYRYLRSCEPVELEVTIVSVADRLATLGERTREDAIEAHVALARELAADAVAWRSEPRAAPLKGDELMSELELEPGPRIGQLLELLREASFAGEIHSREDAIELARGELGR